MCKYELAILPGFVILQRIASAHHGVKLPFKKWIVQFGASGGARHSSLLEKGVILRLF